MDPTDSKIPALGVHDNTVAESSTLRESLIFSMVPSQLDLGQLYIPAGRLQSLLSPEQITSELEKLNISLDAESLLTFVTSHAPNIFGILVYIRAESRIVDFYTKNVRDADLPFHRDSKDKVTIEDKDTDKFTVFADWSETEEKEFLDAQWRFCVPQFSPTTEIVDYPTRTIFPFSVGMAKGALDSMVRQVRVHPEHGSAVRQVHLTLRPSMLTRFFRA